MVIKKAISLIFVLISPVILLGVTPAHADTVVKPKVMIISMFGPESKPILDNLGPWTKYPIPGLSTAYPDVSCNNDEICSITTNMGYANAASSISALEYSHQFDLRKTYFIIAGIAGINPNYGTTGSAAWANYIVDFGLQQELSQKQAPLGWNSGYVGIDSKNPNLKGPLAYGTELYTLNPKLVSYAFNETKNVKLSDSPEAIAYRVHFPNPPANQPPTVINCDTDSGDTWFSGSDLAQRADHWTKVLTDGKGKYCTTQQEDNATLTALTRGKQAGLVDTNRVLDLRTGSDFDRQYPGQTAADNLLNYSDQGGFGIATENIYLTLKPLLADIVAHWSDWEQGIYA